jgi:aryl carrier-like protein
MLLDDVKAHRFGHCDAWYPTVDSFMDVDAKERRDVLLGHGLDSLRVQAIATQLPCDHAHLHACTPQSTQAMCLADVLLSMHACMV